MSDITINSNGSQEENQKTTPVTESLFEPASSIHCLSGVILQIWLGWRGSNPRMHGPKPCALPLGDTPIDARVHYYSKPSTYSKY